MVYVCMLIVSYVYISQYPPCRAGSTWSRLISPLHATCKSVRLLENQSDQFAKLPIVQKTWRHMHMYKVLPQWHSVTFEINHLYKLQTLPNMPKSVRRLFNPCVIGPSLQVSAAVTSTLRMFPVTPVCITPSPSARPPLLYCLGNGYPIPFAQFALAHVVLLK